MARSCATRVAANNKDYVCEPTILAGINRLPPSETISRVTRAPYHQTQKHHAATRIESELPSLALLARLFVGVEDISHLAEQAEHLLINVLIIPPPLDWVDLIAQNHKS